MFYVDNMLSNVDKYEKCIILFIFLSRMFQNSSSCKYVWYSALISADQRSRSDYGILQLGRPKHFLVGCMGEEYTGINQE